MELALLALLLAAALTVSLLGARGELIGMRANGIPAPVALAPVLLICFLVAPLYFAFSDWVLPESNALYRQLKDEANRQRSGTSSRAAVWYRVGDQVYEAEALDSREGTARNIIVYEIDDEGRPYSRVDARRASHIDFYSNHRKTIRYRAESYPTYISSPYTRVAVRVR